MSWQYAHVKGIPCKIWLVGWLVGWLAGPPCKCLLHIYLLTVVLTVPGTVRVVVISLLLQSSTLLLISSSVCLQLCF